MTHRMREGVINNTEGKIEGKIKEAEMEQTDREGACES